MILTAHLGGPGHLAEPTSRRARIRWRSRSESRASYADGKRYLEVEASRGPRPITSWSTSIHPARVVTLTSLRDRASPRCRRGRSRPPDV